MPGFLYVVATPIGNLSDFSYRAITTLKEVNIIAAEDTRHTLKLLNHYNIQNKLISYNDHNKKLKVEYLIEELKNGKNIALVSDAGTPTISDPGYHIIKKCRENDIKVIPIPGVSSVIAALSASGFPTDEFKFIGFLPQGEKNRQDEINKIVNDNFTVIFFESPQRIIKTLNFFDEISKNSIMFIARELTKIHETFYHGLPSLIIQKLKDEFKAEDNIKGEFTVIFSKSDIKQTKKDISNIIEQEINKSEDKKLSTKSIISKISDLYDIPRKIVYKEVVKFLGLTRGKKGDMG